MEIQLTKKNEKIGNLESEIEDLHLKFSELKKTQIKLTKNSIS